MQPHIPYLKCNSDAAILNLVIASLKHSGDSISYGLVICNASGGFVGAKAEKLTSNVSILEVEPLSIHEALSWQKELGFHIIIEMDNRVLYEALCSQEHYFDL